jgi:hypothetical protein
MKQIDLMDASPALAELKDVAIPVPGTYDPNSNLIYVQGMGEVLPIIESKQRPRRLFVRGSDGTELRTIRSGPYVSSANLARPSDSHITVPPKFPVVDTLDFGDFLVERSEEKEKVKNRLMESLSIP